MDRRTIKVLVTTVDGREVRLDGREGYALMEAIRDAGIDDVFAMCGGACACATCHVFVEPSDLEKLEPMSSAEDDLLSFSDHRRPNSRLSCQIPLTAALEGLRVTIAPDDEG